MVVVAVVGLAIERDQTGIGSTARNPGRDDVAVVGRNGATARGGSRDGTDR